MEILPGSSQAVINRYRYLTVFVHSMSATIKCVVFTAKNHPSACRCCLLQAHIKIYHIISASVYRYFRSAIEYLVLLLAPPTLYRIQYINTEPYILVMRMDTAVLLRRRMDTCSYVISNIFSRASSRPPQSRKFTSQGTINDLSRNSKSKFPLIFLASAL